MEKSFGKWLSEILVSRKMKPAELARALGRDSGFVSNIRNDKRSPDVDSCKVIAAALHMPLEEVYRAAGILPPKPDIDPITETVIQLMLELDSDDRQEVLEYIRLRHRLATEHNKS